MSAPNRRIVLAACGHWWREDVHPTHEDDENGEMRPCLAHVEPMRYPVYYLPNAPLAKYRVDKFSAMDPDEGEVP